METKGLVEQHIHGAFGYDFMKCSVEELLDCADKLAQCGVTAFFPTIMTDDLAVIKNQIKVVKEAKQRQKKETAQIVGVHLEGPFINSDKSGIHEKKYILPLEINLFEKIYDEIIKIVTLAPELDNNNFIEYLLSKNIKVSAGHCIGADLRKVNQVTHLYNAMSSFSHREESTVVSSLIEEDLYVEIIADSMHVSDEVLKITFKQKPIDKILLISDALPLAHSDKESHIFAGQTIYNKEGKLLGVDGTMAGSSFLLCDIVKNLANKSILKIEDAILAASSNQIKYHNINNNLKIYWDDSYSVKKVEFV